MNRISNAGAADVLLVQEAGWTVESVDATGAEHCLVFPSSTASTGSCSIGSKLAANTRRIQVLRYGGARDFFVRVEAV